MPTRQPHDVSLARLDLGTVGEDGPIIRVPRHFEAAGQPTIYPATPP